MNGTKIAGMTANGAHEVPPADARSGNPGAVDTKIGGPSSSATATGTGVAVASCGVGTGTTDSSVGVPLASAAIGRTGRHITTVVDWTGVAVGAFGVTRRALWTIGPRGFTETL
jgi:hypothetical protein